MPRVAEETLREWCPFEYPPEHYVGRRLRYKRLLFEFAHRHVTIRALGGQSGERPWLCEVLRHEGQVGWDVVVRTFDRSSFGDIEVQAMTATARRIELDADFETACLYGIALGRFEPTSFESHTVR